MKSLLFLFFACLIVFVFFDNIRLLLVNLYGEGFYNYAIGFIIEGKEGIENEGTISTLVNYISVLPSDFPGIVSGYGFYGGQDFRVYTDSGYARMFLSVGYPLGVLFYAAFVVFFLGLINGKRFIFVSFFVTMAIAEFKEPAIFSGYASRLFIFTCVLAAMTGKLDNVVDSPNRVLHRNAG